MTTRSQEALTAASSFLADHAAVVAGADRLIAGYEDGFRCTPTPVLAHEAAGALRKRAVR